MEKENTTIFCRPPKEPTNRNWQQLCVQCGQTFYSVREDAKFCCQLCRIHYYRQTHKPAGNVNEKKPYTELRTTKILFSACCMAREWTNNEDMTKIRDFLKNNLGISKHYTENYSRAVSFIEDWNNEHPNEKYHYRFEKETFKEFKNKYTLLQIQQKKD